MVQLHLRVASGLQALQRCSGLLNRRARGSTVATHHFEGRKRIEESHEEFDSLRAQQRVPAFCNLPSSLSRSAEHCSARIALRLSCRAMLGAPFAPVAQAPERRASNAEVAGEIPAGSTILWSRAESRRPERHRALSGPRPSTLGLRLSNAGLAQLGEASRSEREG